MSRGPGRLQRAVLFVLEHDSPSGGPEWTTSDVCLCLSGVSTLPMSDPDPIAVALAEQGEHGWWWDEVLDRQVRRALDRLHVVGRIEKRLVPNEQYKRATVALWRLVRQ